MLVNWYFVSRLILPPFANSLTFSTVDCAPLNSSLLWINVTVEIFDNSGNFLEKLGTNGPAPGQFNLPTGIESDSEDRIYVVDRSNDRVQILLYSTDKPISLELTKDDTNLINLIGELENTLRIDSALIEIKTLTGDTILQDSILINSDGKFNFDFELPQNLVDDAYNAIITIEVDGTTITKTKTIFLYDEIPEGETCPVGQKPFFIEETSLWDCRDENTGLVVEADDKNFFSSIIEIIKSILRSIRGSVWLLNTMKYNQLISSDLPWKQP